MAQSRRHKETRRQVGIIPYGRQTIDGTDIRAVESVFHSRWLTQGPTVSKFEKAVAKKVGAKFAVAVSSGTAALHIAYLAAGLGSGDEIIVPANTFVATANMLLAVGAKPVFCDIRMDTYNMDEALLEKLITTKTKAIVPVHYAGHPVEMDNIFRIAKKHNLIVIEDACHALGTRYHGKPIGGLSSAMSVFSFHPVKVITTGEGGMVTTADEKLYRKLLLLRNHGITKDENGWNSMVTMGFNYRMTDIQAALGVSQLKKLDRFIEARRKRVGIYAKLLSDFEDVILPCEAAGCSSVWHLYPVLLALRHTPNYQHIVTRLKECGIGIQRHYPPVYRHPYYEGLGYRKGIAPNAEAFYAAEMSLPLFPTLTKEQQQYVAKTLRNVLKKESLK